MADKDDDMGNLLDQVDEMDSNDGGLSEQSRYSHMDLDTTQRKKEKEQIDRLKAAIRVMVINSQGGLRENVVPLGKQSQ